MATKIMSKVFFFGPQSKGEGEGAELLEVFLKTSDITNQNFPKPFYTPYDEYNRPAMILEDKEYQKECEENGAIVISDSGIVSKVPMDARLPPKLSLFETRIVQISNAIRNKPNWRKKILDMEIVEHWISELKGTQIFKQYNRGRSVKLPQIDGTILNYAFAELKFLSSLCDDKIEVSSVTGVWQSDNLISETLLQELQKGVAILENVPEDKKDWHPDSGSMVLDLVHPSLFCWVNGVTPLYEPEKNSCKRYFVNIQPNRDFTRSRKYQWLPSDFRVDENGEVQILSYINNLDPNVHRPLYDTIAKIFEKFVPLFEKVLSDLLTVKKRHNWGNEMYKWIPYEKAKTELERWEDEYPSGDKEEVEEDGPQNKKRKVDRPPKPVVPEMPKDPNVKFSPYVLQDYTLKGRILQVIVKLANIELTPESPSYPGGSWHVEGMRNEDIVSSGIYYYESENITESVLNFRVASELHFGDYDRDGHKTRCVNRIYGVANGVNLNDMLGGLITKKGRCIAFPNVFQHQVAPFELVDKTKKGVRKILVFFLIDPNHRVLSTANAPPQNKAWAMRELAVIFHTLPKFILAKIISHLPLMDLKEAKKHREKLMEERKQFVQTSTEKVFERGFSLCEH